MTIDEKQDIKWLLKDCKSKGDYTSTKRWRYASFWFSSETEMPITAESFNAQILKVGCE